MATSINTTSRRGVIGAVAAISAASLCGTAIAATPQPDLVRLLKEASAKRDAMLQRGLDYSDLKVEGRLLAFREAQYEYEWAIEELLDLAETL